MSRKEKTGIRINIYMALFDDSDDNDIVNAVEDEGYAKEVGGSDGILYGSMYDLRREWSFV